MINIIYDGEWPCLCMGTLKVTVTGKLLNKTWTFPSNCLSSGGSVSFDSHWNEIVTQGDWYIYENRWPKEFPDEYKKDVIEEINKVIPKGCCGGCV